MSNLGLLSEGWDEFDDLPTEEYVRLDRYNRLRGPCSDDAEVTAPYIGVLPDESDTDGGSPLRLK